MKSEQFANQLAHRGNAFGFLRLLFASMVIISHSSAILYGNSDHEPMMWLFGTMSFGDFAVDGFFLISGFLITASYFNSKNNFDYFSKRVARIYPGFIVCFLICVFVVAPLAGATTASYEPSQLMEYLTSILTLRQPMIDGVFANTHYPFINGSMWTISFEFECYILIAIVGAIGLLRNAKLMMIMTILLLLIASPNPFWFALFIDPAPFQKTSWPGEIEQFIISQEAFLRLAALYLSGSTFYLFRDKLIIAAWTIPLATLILIGGLFFKELATMSVAIFGGYLIFVIAAKSGTTIKSINRDSDISYGVYLYAWPITKLCLLAIPNLTLVPLMLLTLCISYLCGWASWHIVEKPMRSKIIAALSKYNSSAIPKTI